ncbi:MAG: serine/threonine protein kinase [Planctomycetaceae bacterium]|nr:serine/threonine protein kinase [Planctomycetaceae bacterium]
MKFTFPPESTPLDGYTIKRAIHRGGFGEVYYALSDAGKEVALKLLRNNLQVELRGVKQCMNLKHANLVTIFNVLTDGDDDHWIVMEYVSGKTLATVIDDAAGPLSPEVTQNWLSGMVAGLNYLHDRGIVHRDLKPANVFEEAGTVKIGDIGLAKFITESRRSAQTESVGTVYYMAPEVAHGRYGKEVDIYSLGIVLYEMLTGRVPFDGESTAEILMKHLTEKPDLSPLPSRLRPVLAHALEKDPLKRTPTAAQLLTEFDMALQGIEVATEIPEESFAGGNVSPALPGETARKHRKNARHLRREARKAAEAAAKAARYEHKADRRRRRAQKHANRAAGLDSNGHEGQHARHGSRSAQHVKHDGDSPLALVVKVGAVMLVLMALFAPGSAFVSLRLLFVGGIFAALGYGIVRLFGLLTVPLTGDGASIDSVGNGTPTQVVSGRPFVARHVRQLTPETLRSIPLRNRVADLTGTMTYAVLVTALVTVGLWAMMPGFFGYAGYDVGHFALFAVTTLLGAWAVLVPSKLWEGTTVQSHVRRLTLIGAGALVGAACFCLHQSLMADVGYEFWAHSNVFALFKSAGSRSLLSGDYQPTLVGYMVFFGALFGVRRWWRHSDSFRKKRFRVGSLVLTGLAGFVLPLIFAFPQAWGLMWAVAISIVVQLSSACATSEDRQRLMEGGRNGSNA